MLIKAFHYSDSKIDKFNLNFIGKGNDQFGAGIYFSKDIMPFGEYIYKVELNVRKFLDNTKSFTDKEINFLMKNSPDLEDKLLDWAENRNEAYNLLFNAIKNGEDKAEQYETIWVDAYDFRDKESLISLMSNLVKLGYDGRHISSSKMGAENTQEYYVIFNPDIIKIIDTDKINESDKLLYKVLKFI